MHNGFAIALAWPETLCKQTGAWYEGVMKAFNFNQNGYYKVGHAAIVLVDDKTQTCHYFDFGRYHTPHGFGRVRSAFTDHDLTIKTKAVLSPDKTQITNINAILSELFYNPSTHGSGEIFGTSTSLNFEKALEFILELQQKEFIAYGPFVPKGTNCSRFVCSVLKNAKINRTAKLALQFPATVSPTPMWNLTALGQKKYSYDGVNTESIFENRQIENQWQTT